MQTTLLSFGIKQQSKQWISFSPFSHSSVPSGKALQIPIRSLFFPDSYVIFFRYAHKSASPDSENLCYKYISIFAMNEWKWSFWRPKHTQRRSKRWMCWWSKTKSFRRSLLTVGENGQRTIVNGRPPAVFVASRVDYLLAKWVNFFARNWDDHDDDSNSISNANYMCYHITYLAHRKGKGKSRSLSIWSILLRNRDTCIFSGGILIFGLIYHPITRCNFEGKKLSLGFPFSLPRRAKSWWENHRSVVRVLCTHAR